MKKIHLCCVVITTQLVVQLPAMAQLVPDLSPALQNITERQMERAQQQAIERAMQQAESTQNRVAEQASERQAETVQSQTLERVAGQVERAQTQATERAQTMATERAQVQLEQVQGQIERAQSQIERAQGAIERVQQQLPLPAVAPENLPQEAGAVLAQAAQAASDLGTQVAVTDLDGNLAFVEITLPQGDRAIAFEWIMVVNAAQRQQLENEAGDLLNYLRSTRAFVLNAGELLTFVVPPDLDANDAILQLVPENLRNLMDRNHVFSPRNNEEDYGFSPAPAPAQALPLALPLHAVCERPLGLGLIDSHIDTDHPAFQRLQGTDSAIVSRNFVEGKLQPEYAHGTAVAAMLVGSHTEDNKPLLAPLLPNARLYSAAVFHKADNFQEGASAQRILAALDWLAEQEQVQVINMSLAGPANRVLEQTIAALTVQGKIVVAAMGNEGPFGQPRYPAAYDNVIAVGAATSDGNIYRWSSQGQHVDYTAVGADIMTAAQDQGFAAQSGTSLAAPVISAFTACSVASHDNVAEALSALDNAAIDLGEKGRDPVYGKGLLHPR